MQLGQYQMIQIFEKSMLMVSQILQPYFLSKKDYAEPSKFGATLNSGYFRFLSISDCGEALELLFSAELTTNCLSLNMVYKMYLSCNFE